MAVQKKYIFVFLLALAVRIPVALFADRLLLALIGEGPSTPDTAEYIIHADNIMAGNSYGTGYPTITRGWCRAPGYPIFLSVLFTLFGKSLLIVRIIQSCIDGLTALFIILIGQELFDNRTGLLAGCMYALYPQFIINSSSILTECLFTYFYIMAIFGIMRMLNKKASLSFSFFTGCVFAAAALVRTPAFVFFPFCIAFGICLTRTERSSLTGFAFAAAGFGIITGTWIYQAWMETSRIIPIATAGIINLWLGNSAYGMHYYFKTSTSWALRDQFIHLAYNQESSSWFLQNCADFIREKPVVFLKMKLLNFINFWNMVPKVSGRPPVRIIANFLSVSIIPLTGLAGLSFKCWNGFDKNTAFVLLVVIFFTVMHVVTYGNSRFRIALIDPLLMIYASSFFISLFSGLLKKPCSNNATPCNT